MPLTFIKYIGFDTKRSIPQMNKLHPRIIALFLSLCLIIAPRPSVALLQQQSTVGLSAIAHYKFEEQALAARAIHQDHFLDQKVGDETPRINALRLEASVNSTGVGDKSSNDSNTSADDRPVLVRAFPATLGQFLCKTFGNSGGMISLDGPTGHGKSTFANALERETDRSGFTGNIVVILLDDFHRTSGWR